MANRLIRAPSLTALVLKRGPFSFPSMLSRLVTCRRGRRAETALASSEAGPFALWGQEDVIAHRRDSDTGRGFARLDFRPPLGRQQSGPGGPVSQRKACAIFRRYHLSIRAWRKGTGGPLANTERDAHSRVYERGPQSEDFKSSSAWHGDNFQFPIWNSHRTIQR